MILAVCVAIIAWGALAFGAVYPWAYRPLLGACALAGLLGLFLHRAKPFARTTRTVLVALAVVLAAAAVQLVPLPVAVLKAISPSTDAFLRNYDLAYAFDAAAWHPLSLDPRATTTGIAFLVAFTLFLAGVVRTLSLSRSTVRRLAGLIVTFGVVLALVGIVQKATLGEHAWAGMKIYGFWAPANLLSTPFGPYINKNHFAGWMLMGLPLALGVALGMAEQGRRHLDSGWRSGLLWLSSPEGGRLQLAVIAALIMGASLLMTRSRSGVACLVLATVLTSVVAGRRFRSARAGVAALASLAVLFFIVFVMAGSDLTARIANRLDVMELRKSIWTDSASAIADFPLAGTGVNTFGTAMINYQTTQRDQHFQEAHNDYLQVVVEGGLLVALPALVTLVLIVRAIRRRFAAGQDDAAGYWIRAGATIGLVAVAAQAFVEFTLQMPGNAALFVLLLAIALHEAPASRPQPAAREATHP